MDVFTKVWSSPGQVDSNKKSIMPRPFPDILSGKGREVFLGTFLYYRIEYILELLDRPFHMFLGALNTTSLYSIHALSKQFPRLE